MHRSQSTLQRWMVERGKLRLQGSEMTSPGSHVSLWLRWEWNLQILAELPWLAGWAPFHVACCFCPVAGLNFYMPGKGNGCFLAWAWACGCTCITVQETFAFCEHSCKQNIALADGHTKMIRKGHAHSHCEFHVLCACHLWILHLWCRPSLADFRIMITRVSY